MSKATMDSTWRAKENIPPLIVVKCSLQWQRFMAKLRADAAHLEAKRVC